MDGVDGVDSQPDPIPSRSGTSFPFVPNAARHRCPIGVARDLPPAHRVFGAGRSVRHALAAGQRASPEERRPASIGVVAEGHRRTQFAAPPTD